MLEVKKLKKVYHDDSGDCVALNGVSFKLPSKGMIFVVGKSGCGKTTLLNAIGGLDQFTSGDIIINNKGLSKFSVVEFDNYRNSTVGFVFQDFCLIEGLSVIDNIKLSLEFQNSKKEIDYDKLLKDIGLEGLGKRYPKQLSAGQKQRVAIARAIVKEPEIILADEPTGNLDENTSNQIMQLLKEISKERLVMVISHNPDEANEYADRILEMDDGKIISDKALNIEYIEEPIIENHQTILPGNGYVSFDDLEKINKKINKSEGNYKIYQSDEKFIEKESLIDDENINLKSVKMSSKTKLKYAGFFFKKKIFFNLFMMILLTVVASFLAIIEVLGFIDFNNETKRILDEENYDQTYMIYNESGNSNMSKANVELIDSIINDNNGKVGYIYPISLSYNNIYSSFVVSGNTLSYKSINNGKIIESSGVYITDYKTMLEKTNNGNEIEVLSGEIDEESLGVIITDYLADCIMFYDDTFSSYDDIVDAGFIYDRLDIDAVISSDVYEKYEKELELFDIEEEVDYVLDIIYDYSLCYSLNSNFIDDYKKYLYENNLSYANASAVTLTSNFKMYSNERCTGYFNSELKEDEALISYEFYNSIFDTNLSKNDESSFVQAPIKIELYDYNNECFFEKEFTIIGVYEQKDLTDAFRISDEYYMDIADSNLVPLIIEIFNEGDIYDILYELQENNCIEIYVETGFIFKTIQLLSVFYEVFMYIAIIVIIAIFLIIILNASTIIRQNVYDIGVMKALGAKTSELIVIFTLQMVITSLGVCLLLYPSSYLFMELANTLLCNGISAYIVKDVFYNVILFSPKFFMINIISISVFTILSIMVPILFIRKIKPLKIIKTRN